MPKRTLRLDINEEAIHVLIMKHEVLNMIGDAADEDCLPLSWGERSVLDIITRTR
jgi:hypothetical protein